MRLPIPIGTVSYTHLINIGLAITGKREDGYHDIDSIFQSIRLSDSIYFAKHHSVVFSGGAPELPEYMQKLVTYGEENLALKALRAIQAYTGCKAGAAIHLLKRVPIQALSLIHIYHDAPFGHQVYLLPLQQRQSVLPKGLVQRL